MTTQSWSTVAVHGSDAEFRAWGLELSTKLLAAGLVQTSDTGQVNWATVTRPGTNSNGGYEIWRMNDTQQATAPVFFRIDYGTGSAATNPRIQITVGTGTNGAGTLTGTALTTARSIHGSAAPSLATSYQSYVCVADGFFGLAWKVSTTSAFKGLFLFCRTCDADGLPTAEGANVVWGNGVATAITAVQMLRFATSPLPAQAYTAQTTQATAGMTAVPGNVTSSQVGTDFQVYLNQVATPRVRGLFGQCTVLITEVSQGSTFSAVMVGTTLRTFIGLGSVGAAESSSSATYGFAMLWE